MSIPSIGAFRSNLTELPPILTPQKSPKSPQIPISFAQKESQSSIESSESKSSCTSDVASSQSSDTTTDSASAKGGDSDPATAVPETPVAPTAPRKNVKIKYKLEVYDTFKSEWNTVTQDDQAFDLSRVNDPSDNGSDAYESPPAIFEVITKADGFDKRRRKINFQNSLKELVEDVKPTTEEPKLPPLKFVDLKVTEVIETRIEIHSQGLLEAIRQVVDYYPNQNLSGDIVIIHEPYWIVIHHEKELRNLHRELSSPSRERSAADKETAEHLKIFLNFVQPQIDRIVPTIERLLGNKVPTITFDALWYLLKPGTLAYCQYAGEWIGCVIMRVKGKKQQNSKRIDRWNIHVWFLSHSDKLYQVYTESNSDEKLQTKHSIPWYEGEQDVTGLKVIPREYWDAVDHGARRKEFEERGARKLQLMGTRFQQMSHKGETIEKVKRLYHGRVILDDRVDIEVSDASDTLWAWWSEITLKDDIWMNKRGAGSSQRISKLVKLFELDKNDSEKLKIQTWLLSPNISCFALDIKSWFSTHIDRLSPPEESAAPTKLVMEESHLKIIKSLTASQTGAKEAWAADSIKNKGKGVIILLHGPPGVGKTYSVECTAVAIKRPLLALTIADIGIKEDSIETELTSWFYLAERWKAILLIDEADIFLERRAHTDLARNGVVSAFLRKMEYFSGLLFLTTNRVGHIDEAFMSRVHVVIGYPQLDDAKRRELWEGFFRKMRADTKGSIRVSPAARAYVMQDAKDLKIKLNGREIRNTLQTAIALAEFEAKEDPDYSEDDNINVEKDHFERVLNLSRNFRVYLDSIKGNTVEARATNYYGRNDYDKVSEEKLN